MIRRITRTVVAIALLVDILIWLRPWQRRYHDAQRKRR